MRRVRSPLALSLLFVACGSSPQSITVVADCSTAVADGVDAATITATRSGADDFVDFTVSTGGQLSATHVKSVSGVATTKVTASTAPSR